MEIDLSSVVVLDTETTGLNRDRNEVWEVSYDIDGEEKTFHFPVDLERADHIALKMNGFWERYPFLNNKGNEREVVRYESQFADAQEIMFDLHGRHIVGAVPNFDDNFLWKLLRSYNLMDTWHYHLIDIETLVVGYQIGRWAEAGLNPNKTQQPGPFNLSLPWKSDELSQYVGVDAEQFDRHSALGDVRWAKAQLEAILNGVVA